MRIRKSRCVELNRTCYYTGKFNVALSLCKVLSVTLYFSEGFSEVTARVSIVAEALQPLGVAMVCFLEQEFSLWSFVLHRLFLKYFLCSLLVNLPLLASLEERSTHRELGCFLGARDRDDLEEGFLADKVARNEFALFRKATVEPEVEAFSYFQE